MKTGFPGQKKNGKARKGTGTKTGLPFSETGYETGFLRIKNGTKVERKRVERERVERKRGENRIFGSKNQFKAGKGTRNRKRRPG